MLHDSDHRNLAKFAMSLIYSVEDFSGLGVLLDGISSIIQVWIYSYMIESYPLLIPNLPKPTKPS